MPRLGLESWLCVMHEVALLRLPLLFGRSHGDLSHGDLSLTEGGAVATMGVDTSFDQAAASKVVMRSGRHAVQFTVMAGIGMGFGVIRAGWDVEGGENAFNVDGHYFYGTGDGLHDWEGMQDVNEQGDRIGLLLDLDQGSMTVWKNDVKLGVMVAEGLSGPYCWAAELCNEGDRARMESAPAPASPTEEELSAAKAREAAH